MTGFQSNHEFEYDINDHQAADDWDKQEEINKLKEELRKKHEYFSSFHSDMFDEIGELKTEIKSVRESHPKE